MAGASSSTLTLTRRSCVERSRHWKDSKFLFGLGPATRIYVALGATDMRKGFDGLHGIVRDRLGLEVRTGHLLQWPIDCTQLIGEASSSADYAPISSFLWQTVRLDRAQVPFRRKLFIFLSPIR